MSELQDARNKFVLVSSSLSSEIKGNFMKEFSNVSNDIDSKITYLDSKIDSYLEYFRKLDTEAQELFEIVENNNNPSTISPPIKKLR